MPFEAYDFQERYLRAVFAFIGIEDFEIVRAEGLAFGPEQREPAVRAALARTPRRDDLRDPRGCITAATSPRKRFCSPAFPRISRRRRHDQNSTDGCADAQKH
jgi:hypothetical protein